ncbi:DUF2637 domain-containing protein [Streptomyces sp. G1]|uniref:DUF2637 domain-containing protein n=1 Tax=Streptomyces sp. G1 TaxID=361572 RepID=UPI00202F1102|nr:DUF2637 domain-containing protein [Streptomyces sp. G1]MCM1968002.1 DUF2637 domain-containing protein [Streptomyces sp. G1]
MTGRSSARITGWDRAAVITLGGAACALSYDALQQMATAIHVRGLLTYLFPLVIDGFIAYGVRALLVMSSAPLAARCYVWTLFGTATAASIWANALHAIRLNQQQVGSTGLRLGDLTVGILSTLAPLALAGSVHLYILIARRAAEPAVSGQSGHPITQTVRLAVDRPENTGGGTEYQQLPVDPGRSAVCVTGSDSRLAHTTDRDGQLGAVPGDSDEPVQRAEAPAPEIRPGATVPTGEAARPSSVTRLHLAKPPTPQRSPGLETGRPEAPTGKTPSDDLLLIARHAVTEAGKATRQVVADAIRGQGLPLANDRLTGLMEQLRVEAKEHQDTRTG